ncbi:ExeM/NucH family extracellular endonuclease [Flavitalea antarctica]
MLRIYTLMISFFVFANYISAQSPSPIVINEIYGGGGNSGATYKADFIELYNNSNLAIDLSGWSIQYAAAAGTNWQRTNLTGSIPAGGYYLIRQALGTGGTVDLPTPDVVGTIPMSGTAGKVALLRTNTTIPAGTSCPRSPEYQLADFVGFGTANCFEGTGPTVAPSNTNSVSRSALHTDTDNNNADFTSGAPSPVNSQPEKTISITAFADAGEPSTAGSITISFSAATTAVTTFSYNIATGTGSATLGTDYSLSLNGGAIPSAITSTSGNITVPAGVSSLVLTITPINDAENEGNETITFSISNPDGGYTTGTASEIANVTDDDLSVTKIHLIQGTGSTATAGSYAIEGIVTGVFSDWSPAGYYVQEEETDKDDNINTSEGIFVVQANPTSLVGDKVRVVGRVQENNSTPSFNQAVIISSSFTTLSAGNILPAPTSFELPVTTQADLEKYEGMLVQHNGTLTVTDNSELGNRGSLRLSAGGAVYQPTQIIDPNDTDPSGNTTTGNSNIAAVSAYNTSTTNRSIILDDGSNVVPQTLPYVNSENTIRVGTTLDNLNGILGFGFSTFRIQPVSYAAPVFNYALRPSLPPLGGNLKIASFNVLNYFNGDGMGGGFPTSRGANSVVEFNRQRDKIISALAEMNADIVGLIEIENDGTGPASAIQDLVNGLNERLGVGTYSFVLDGLNSQLYNTDQIRAGIIYKSSVVTPVGGVFTSADGIFDRPPLAQTFMLNTAQKTFTYIINHFKSKGSCPPANTSPNPDLDAGDGQGCWNERRKQQAAALVSLINTVIVPATGNDRVITMGDYNAYYEEDPMDVLRSNGLIVLGSSTSYSYLFDGQLGSLDHAVLTASMNELLAGFAKWNINSTEPTYLDYNDAVRDAAESTTDVNPWAATYTPSPWRSSDHDAVIASFTINSVSDLSVVKSGPGTVKTGGMLTYNIVVQNQGPDHAKDIVLSDTLPAGTSFVSFTAPSGWTTSVPQPGEGGVVKATSNTLASGVEQAFSIVVKVDCELNATVIENSVTVSAGTEDPGPSNNTSSISTNVEISRPVVIIPDARVLPQGVKANTVYLGYAPASSLQLSSITTGGTEPYNYLWSTGATTQGVMVNPTQTTTYLLTVADNNGCAGTAIKTVTVVDVRAGKNGSKVVVCHDRSKNIEVDTEAVKDHLGHGDMLGVCEPGGNSLNVLSLDISGKLSVRAFPNPSTNFFNIQLQGSVSYIGNLVVRDVTGRVVESRMSVAMNKSLQIGHSYRKGIYFVELSDGGKKIIFTLIKY